MHTLLSFNLFNKIGLTPTLMVMVSVAMGGILDKSKDT